MAFTIKHMAQFVPDSLLSDSETASYSCLTISFEFSYGMVFGLVIMD